MYRAMQDSTRLSCCRLARPRAHARLSGEANGDDLALIYFFVPKVRGAQLCNHSVPYIQISKLSNL